MKKLASIGLSVCLSGMFLVGCGSAASDPDTDGTNKFEENRVVQIPVTENGITKNVTCVWLKNGYAGGTSCDWVGYHSSDSKPAQ